MHPFRWVGAWILLVSSGFGLGCAEVQEAATAAGTEDAGPEADDPISFEDAGADGFMLVERSPEAEAILRFVDDASAEELTASSGVRLSARVAAGIVSRRAGPDATAGTVDDRPFYSLAELDAVPYVGPAVLARLVAYVRANPIVDTACAATDTRPFPLELVIAPGPGEARLVELLARARRSIDVTIYQFTSEPIRTALESAAGRGVRVRVILDRRQDENAPLVDALRAAGIEARLSSATFTYTHQKTVTIDEETTFVFSGNLETRGFATSRNFGAIDRDFEDVRDFDTLFEADWTDTLPELACTRLVYSPINSRARIDDLIRNAQESIEIEAMYVTDSAVFRALGAARMRGVSVRLLLNDPRFGITSSARGVRALAEWGAEIRRLPSMFIHAKVMIVDSRWFFVGSENYSSNSLEHNREAGVVIASTDADLAPVQSALDTDWAAAVPY